VSQADLFRWGDDRPWTPKRASVEALETLPIKVVREDHRRILLALLEGPMCDAALLEATGVHPNALRARRGELVTAGLVVAQPDPVEWAGRRVTAWGLVSK
jgi:predicted ArsR family transcriptional regulator